MELYLKIENSKEVIALLFLIFLTTCSGSVETPGNLALENKADIWGCWGSAEPGGYDITLQGSGVSFEYFVLGNECASDTVGGSGLGAFTADTLFIFNGENVYWCHVVGDSLEYSSKIKGSTLRKLYRKSYL